MKNHHPEKDFVPEWISNLVLCIGLACAAFFAYQRSEQLQRAVLARAERQKARQERLFRNPASIESWMTFDYVDKVFGLPESYLKESLAISDARYPRMTIHSYVKKMNLPESEFLAFVRNAVASYKK